jgi:hypothetical protein
MHTSTRITPFWALSHHNLQMQINAPMPPALPLKSEVSADAVLGGLEETHRVLCENLLDAHQRQSKYAGSKDITLT